MFRVSYLDRTGLVLERTFLTEEEARDFYENNFYKYASMELSHDDELLALWNENF